MFIGLTQVFRIKYLDCLEWMINSILTTSQSELGIYRTVLLARKNDSRKYMQNKQILFLYSRVKESQYDEMRNVFFLCVKTFIVHFGMRWIRCKYIKFIIHSQRFIHYISCIIEIMCFWFICTRRILNWIQQQIQAFVYVLVSESSNWLPYLSNAGWILSKKWI